MKGLIKRLMRKFLYSAIHNNPDVMKDFIRHHMKSYPDLIKEAYEYHELYRYKVYGIQKGLSISEKSSVSNALFNTASGTITIKDHVFFGQNVVVNAAKHDYTKTDEERMKAIPSSSCDILIEEGVWICSHSTIVGPCTIGRNAVILPGSVVVKNVGANEMHGGVPARFIKKINL